MNWRPLVPLAGIAAGVFTGLQVRPETHRKGKSKIPAVRMESGKVEGTHGEEAVSPGFTGLERLWESEGQLGVYAALEGVPAATLAAWLEKVMPSGWEFGSSQAQKRREIREALVERLAASDPVRLAGMVQKMFRRDVDGLAFTATRGLLAADTPEARAALEKLRKRFPEVTECEVSVMADRDPAAAFEIARRQNSCLAIPGKLASWLAADPEKAIEFANRFSDCACTITNAMAAEGNGALETFLAGLAEGRPRVLAKAVQIDAAARAGDSDTFVRLCLQPDGPAGKFNTLVRAHPEAVEEVARKLADKPGMCADMWSALSIVDPAKAVSLLSSPAFAGALGELSNLRPYALSDWHSEDPAAALAWIKSQPPQVLAAVLPGAGELVTDLSASEWLTMASHFPMKPDGDSQLVKQAVAKLTDPAMLATWCGTLPENVRDQVMNQLVQSLAERDTDKATALALAVEDPKQKERSLESIMVNSIIAKTPVEALQWADGLPVEMRAAAITNLLPQMIYHASPEEIAGVSSMAAQRINSEPAESILKWNGLAQRVASALANSDQGSCGTFLAGLPEGLRGQAVQSVAAECCGNLFVPDKIESTLQWIAGMKDPAMRQSLAAGICGTLARGGLTPETNFRVQQALTPFIR